MKFIVEINVNTTGIEEFTGVSFTKRIESESPKALLNALAFTNGTANGVPSLEKLLVHLFEKKAAYCGRNYIIYIQK